MASKDKDAGGLLKSLASSAVEAHAKFQGKMNEKMVETGMSAVLSALTGSIATWLSLLAVRWTWRLFIEEFTIEVSHEVNLPRTYCAATNA